MPLALAQKLMAYHKDKEGYWEGGEDEKEGRVVPRVQELYLKGERDDNENNEDNNKNGVDDDDDEEGVIITPQVEEGETRREEAEWHHRKADIAEFVKVISSFPLQSLCPFAFSFSSPSITIMI